MKLVIHQTEHLKYIYIYISVQLEPLQILWG